MNLQNHTIGAHNNEKRSKCVATVLLVAAGVILIAGLCICLFFNKPVVYSELTEVRMKRMGTMDPSGDEYALTRKDGAWVASHNRIEWLKDHVDEAVVDDVFVSDIVDILKENKAHRWERFHIIAKLFAAVSTDGTNYSFYMSFADGSVFEMDVYNVHPRTYMTVFNAFAQQYDALVNE